MWTGIFKVWEAMDGPLGVLAIILLAYTAGFLRGKLQELRDVKARANEDRAEFKAQLDGLREESRARSKEDRALYMRENAHLSKQFAEHSKQFAEQSKQIAEQSKQIAEHSKDIAALSNQVAEQSKQIAALQGDVQVLLDRSDRSADGNVGTDRTATRYEIARQAVPAPREEEDEEDEQR